MSNYFRQLHLWEESSTANQEQEPVNLINKRTASITVYLTPVEKAQLKEDASREGMTMSDKMREAIKPWTQRYN